MNTILQKIQHFGLKNFCWKNCRLNSIVLYQQLEEQKLLNESLIKVLRDDLRSPILSAVYSLEHLKDQLTQNVTVPSSNIEILSELSQTLIKINNYFGDFAKYQAIYTKSYIFSPVENSINTIINEVYVAQKISLKITKPESKGMYIKTDKQILTLLIRNLLINANLYGSENIWVNIYQEKDRSYLEICNDVSTETEIPIKMIQEKFKKNKFFPTPNDKFKLGLSSINQIAKDANIKVEVLFPPNKFSVILSFSN